MGGFSIWHWMVVALAIILLFGRGRFSAFMHDIASGIRSFRREMDDGDNVPARRDDHA